MTQLRCGRLDRHEAHDWTSPAWGHGRNYHCSGFVLTEMALAQYAADADRREDAA